MSEPLSLMSDIFEKAFTRNPPVSLSWVTAIAFITAGTIFLPNVWSRTRFIVTYVHEFGHGIVSILTGGGMQGIKIHDDTSGVTETYRKKGFIGWISGILTTYFGYPFPGILGGILIITVNLGYTSLSFFVITFIAIILILFMRSFIGLFIGVFVAVFSAGMFYYAPIQIQSIILVGISGFLIAGGCKTVVELSSNHIHGNTDNSDVRTLSHGFPPLAIIIFLSYYALYVACVVAAVWTTINIIG